MTTDQQTRATVWPDQIYEVLKDAGVTQVDSKHTIHDRGSLQTRAYVKVRREGGRALS
jgi:hypothetical protein